MASYQAMSRNTVKAQEMPRLWNHDAYADSAIREPYWHLILLYMIRHSRWVYDSHEDAFSIVKVFSIIIIVLEFQFIFHWK